MKTIFLLILSIVILNIPDDVIANEISQFEFQIPGGEGILELYKIEVDFNKEQGELCFLDTESSNISDALTNKIRDSVKWSTYIDMNKYEHSCIIFNVYGPYVWFYTSEVKYSEANYVFFFVGEMTPQKMEGSIYHFRDFQPNGEKISYKTSGKSEISVAGRQSVQSGSGKGK